MTLIQQQILKLNRDERLRLVQYIIDSIRFEDFDQHEQEHTDIQMEELEKRMRTIDEGKASFVSWDDIKAGLRKA